MSFINDIHITNFKSLRDVVISGCKRINVFIGEPNVGKSNILEGLGLLGLYYLGFNFGNIKSLVRTKTITDLFHNGNIDTDFHLGINGNEYFCYAYWVGTLELVTRYLDKDSQTLNEVINMVFDRNGKVLNRKNNSSIENNNFKIPFIKKYDFNNNAIITDGLGGSLDFPEGRNLFGVLSTNKELKKDFVEIFERYHLRLALDKAESEIKLIKETSDSDVFILSLDQIADTLKRLLFYVAAIKSNRDCTLLFEEPEAHLFPPYISHITSEMIYNKSNQYFVATHSQFFLNDLMEDAKDDLAVYVVGYKNGETTINRLSDQQIHEIYNYGIDLFLNIKNYVA